MASWRKNHHWAKTKEEKQMMAGAEIECDFCHIDVPVRTVRVVRAAVQCAQCAAHALSSRMALLRCGN